MYINLHGWVKVFQGDFNIQPLIDKLSKIADDYEYKIARQSQLQLELGSFVQFRKLNDALKSVEKWELFKVSSDIYFTLYFFGLKAELQNLCKEYNEAEKSLIQGEDFYRKQAVVPPMFTSAYLLARFFLDISLLEESILSKNKSSTSKYRKQASESGKRLLQNSKKFAGHRSEAFCLVGRYHWLIGNQKRGVKSWKRAIEEGERMGVRPQVARTYMEIGKRFLEEKSKYNELNGIAAKEYLEKARTMFQEMNLQWDLDELEKITTIG
jgi:hypothetical protein